MNNSRINRQSLLSFKRNAGLLTLS